MTGAHCPAPFAHAERISLDFTFGQEGGRWQPLNGLMEPAGAGGAGWKMAGSCLSPSWQSVPPRSAPHKGPCHQPLITFQPSLTSSPNTLCPPCPAACLPRVTKHGSPGIGLCLADGALRRPCPGTVRRIGQKALARLGTALASSSYAGWAPGDDPRCPPWERALHAMNDSIER
jgi:hypothetical protein